MSQEIDTENKGEICATGDFEHERQIKLLMSEKKRLEIKKAAAPNDKEYKIVQGLLAKAQSGASVNISDTTEAIKSLYEVTIKQKKSLEHQYALYALGIGSLMNELEKQVKKQKLGKWKYWSSTNIPFIKVRTRQDWMRIAAEPDAIQYAHLGISALSLILTAINKLYSKGKYNYLYTEFFKESSYPYQEYAKIKPVKKLIAIHTFEVKSKREQLPIALKSITALAEYPSALNDKLIEEMLQHNQTGGIDAVNNLLNLYIIGKGKNPKLSKTVKVKDKQLSIDRAGILFNNTMSHYLNNFHDLEQVDINTLYEISSNLEKIYVNLHQLYWDKLCDDVMKGY